MRRDRIRGERDGSLEHLVLTDEVSGHSLIWVHTDLRVVTVVGKQVQ